jgi:outer membrane protein assembly factor BamA
MKLKSVSGLIFYVSLFHSPINYAAEWSIDAQLDQNLSYVDNVRMSIIPEGSIKYVLTPVINFRYATETASLQLSSSYGQQNYLNIKGLDSSLQNYSLNSSYLTSRANWGLAANVNVAPSRNTAVQDSGNFASNAQKITESITPSLSYQFTERDSLNLSINYTQTDYSTADLSGNQSQSMNVGWQKQWTPRYSNGLNLSYSSVHFDNTATTTGVNQNSQTDSYSLNLATTYLYSEIWRVNASLGGRFTQALSAASTTWSAGFLLNASLNYTGEKLSAQLNVNRSLMPSSSGQLQEQTGVNLTLNYPYTEKLSAVLSTSYQQSNTTANQQQSQRNNLMLQPTINWQFSPDWKLSAYYQYTYQTNSTQSDDQLNQQVNANVFTLSIHYNGQGWRISR